MTSQIRAISTTSWPSGSVTVTARETPVAIQGSLPHRSDERCGSGGEVRVAAHVQPSTKGRFVESILLDAAGHRRSPVTMPGYHRGRPPRNKGEQYPADPPTVEEIVAVRRPAGDRPDGPLDAGE